MRIPFSEMQFIRRWWILQSSFPHWIITSRTKKLKLSTSAFSVNCPWAAILWSHAPTTKKHAHFTHAWIEDIDGLEMPLHTISFSIVQFQVCRRIARNGGDWVADVRSFCNIRCTQMTAFIMKETARETKIGNLGFKALVKRDVGWFYITLNLTRLSIVV